MGLSKSTYSGLIQSEMSSRGLAGGSSAIFTDAVAEGVINTAISLTGQVLVPVLLGTSSGTGISITSANIKAIIVSTAKSLFGPNSTLYTGSPNPLPGNTEIDVLDASKFYPGDLVIGRGTPNQEIVSFSNSPVENAGFWRITLDSPITNGHTIGDIVALELGGNKLEDIAEAIGTATESHFGDASLGSDTNGVAIFASFSGAISSMKNAIVNAAPQFTGDQWGNFAEAIATGICTEIGNSGTGVLAGASGLGAGIGIVTIS